MYMQDPLSKYLMPCSLNRTCSRNRDTRVSRFRQCSDSCHIISFFQMLVYFIHILIYSLVLTKLYKCDISTTPQQLLFHALPFGNHLSYGVPLITYTGQIFIKTCHCVSLTSNKHQHQQSQRLPEVKFSIIHYGLRFHQQRHLLWHHCLWVSKGGPRIVQIFGQTGGELLKKPHHSGAKFCNFMYPS